jgi:molybdate transport system substrate-binding protein
VPAGEYGKAAVEKLGVWSSARTAVALAERVCAALLFVSRREAPLAIVYATDAAAAPRVKIVGVFPEDTHPLIIYPAALTADSNKSGSSRAARIFSPRRRRGRDSRRGFTVLQ